MKAHILAIIDGFKNERIVTNVRWKEPPLKEREPIGSIDETRFFYRHDGLSYLTKKGEKMALYSFFTAFITVLAITVLL